MIAFKLEILHPHVVCTHLNSGNGTILKNGDFSCLKNPVTFPTLPALYFIKNLLTLLQLREIWMLCKIMQSGWKNPLEINQIPTSIQMKLYTYDTYIHTKFLYQLVTQEQWSLNHEQMKEQTSIIWFDVLHWVSIFFGWIKYVLLGQEFCSVWQVPRGAKKVILWGSKKINGHF